MEKLIQQLQNQIADLAKILVESQKQIVLFSKNTNERITALEDEIIKLKEKNE